MPNDVFQFADQGDAFLRTAEAALSVRNAQQLFLWTRLHLHRFVPHELLLCRVGGGGAAMVQVYNSVPLPAPLSDGLADAEGRFWSLLRELWQAAARQPLVIDLQALAGRSNQAAELRLAGFSCLSVHGVDHSSGVQPELILVCAQLGPVEPQRSLAGLSLWLPHIHFTVARALGEGRAEGGRRAVAAPHPLSARELQVLAAVRSALSNQQIGELLGISALTVKNHLRKIMRKLGAHSRVQAVAEAMSRQWIV